MDKTVFDWLNLSLNDIKASRSLYKIEAFPQSYFLFQQASEKATKALALISMQMNETQLKNAGHNQLKIFRSMINIENGKMLSVLNLIPEDDPIPDGSFLDRGKMVNHQESLEDLGSIFDSLINEDLMDISTQELELGLEGLEETMKSEFVLPMDIKELFAEGRVPILKTLELFDNEENMDEILDEIIGDEQIMSDIERVLEITLKDLPFIALAILSCALLTTKHSTSTRYPVNGVFPEEIYSLDLPIVKYQMQYLNFLEKAVQRAIDVFDFSDEEE